ncbi:MAG: MBL fold metallo-hydrolase [Thermoplasmata archaeon]|nr:MBL fold metallo-hydrolase [Thermoplasmata archaeon]
MSFQFCVLGSGSSGNSVAIWDDETLFLVDAGFSCKETVRRLNLAGLDANDLDTIFISHEHSDHINGARVLNKRFSPRVLSTEPVHEWLDLKYAVITEPELEPGKVQKIGNFKVTPFEVPHDASQTVGFKIQNNGRKLIIATDLGHVTARLRQKFMDADALVLESNHDVQMLKDGKYPYFLKKRILGKQGHLSNEQSAEVIANVITEKTKHILLAHLSQDNNVPEKALAESKKELKKVTGRRIEIIPASQFEISKIINV